jgi:hypothetical protein
MLRQSARLLLVCLLWFLSHAWAQQTNNNLLSINSAAVSLQLDGGGIAYGLDREGQVWRKLNQASSNWQRLPGRFVALRVGMDDSVWGITNDAQVFKLNSQTWWQKFTADVTDIAIGPDGALVVLGTDGSTYQLDISTGEKLAKLPPTDLSITRIRSDEHGLLWAWSSVAPQPFLRRFDGRQWSSVDTPIGSGVRELSIGPQGAIMVVNQLGIVYRWDSAIKQWFLLDQLQDIGDVALGPADKPWFLTNSGRILTADLFIQNDTTRIETKPALFTRLLKWKRVRGASADISISSQGEVLTVDTESNVWQWKGKDNWTLMPGRMRKVAAAAQGVWGIDLEGRVLKFSGGYWAAQGLSQASHIAVADNGDAFALAENGKLFVFNAIKRQWFPGGGPTARYLAVGKSLPWLIDLQGVVWTWRDGAWFELPAINAQTIGVGSEGSVYITTPDQSIFWLDQKEKIWKAASGKASQIAVGLGGAPWIVGDRNETYGSTLFFSENDKIIQTRDAQNQVPNRPVFSIPPPAASILPQSNKPVTLTSFSGAYQDVGVGADGSVLAVGIDSGLYCLQKSEQRFAVINGAIGRKVAIDQNGMPWLINAAQDLQRFSQGRWQSLADFKASHVTVGSDGTVYAIEKNQQTVYKIIESAAVPIMGGDGTALRAKKLAALGSQLWLINSTDRVSMCTSRKCIAYNQTAQDIAASADGTVMIVDNSGALLRYDPKLDTFINYPTTVNLSKVVSLAPQGFPWLVSQAGIISGPVSKARNIASTEKDCAERFRSQALNTATVNLQLIARPDNVRVVPGGVFNPLANDSINGLIANQAAVMFRLTSASPLLAVISNGLQVSSQVPVGAELTATYTICAQPTGMPCSSSSISVTVISAQPPPIVSVPIVLQAQADNASVVVGATASINVLGNDLRNGLPVLSSQISLNLLSGSSQFMTVVGRAILINAGAQAGDSLVGSYAICALPTSTPCSTATLTVQVVAAPIVLQAIADNANMVVGLTATINVLVNDLSNGQSVVPFDVSLNLLAGSSQLMSVSNSAILINAGAQAGDTLLGRYVICVLPANTPCSTATLTVQVAAAPIVLQAQADAGSVAAGATVSINVLANDLRNGQPVLTSQVSLNLLAGSSQFFSVSGAAILVSSGAQAGDTLIGRYTICALPTNTPCSVGTVTVQVTAAPVVLQAQADTANVYTGVTATINVLANDLRNGLAVLPSQVNINLLAGSSQFMSVAGSAININPGASAGDTLQGNYAICALPSGVLCSTTTLTIQVAKALVLNPDAVTLNYNAAGTSFNLLANDTYLGQAITAPVNVMGTVSNAFAILLSQTGEIYMYAGAPGPAVHTATYSVCLSTAGNPCGTASAAITVGVPTLQALGWTATVAAGGFYEANNGVQYGAGLGTQDSVIITVTPSPQSSNFVNVFSNGVTSSPSRVTVNAFTPPNTVLTGTVDYCNRLQPTQCSTASWQITVQ